MSKTINIAVFAATTTSNTRGSHETGSTAALSWWREVPAPAFSQSHAALLHADLSWRRMPGEIMWRDARQGDAAAAIGVAIRSLRIKDSPTDRRDVALSAVLLCALNGNPAARDVLIYALLRLNSDAADLLAENWRAASFEPRLPIARPQRRRRVAYRARHRWPGVRR